MTVNEFIQQINEEGIYLNMAEKVALIENGEISVVDVFHIVTSNNEPEAFYASWILNHYVDNHNLAVEDYLNEAVDLLPHIKRSGLLRLVLRLFVITPNWKIEKLGEGQLYQYVPDFGVAIAVAEFHDKFSSVDHNHKWP